MRKVALTVSKSVVGEALIGAGVVAVGWTIVAAVGFEYAVRGLYGR
jgi:hypothetical protein